MVGSVVSLGETTGVLYLSGTGSDDTVNWEFKVSGGRRSGEWTTIPVPSNWEMQGFGTHRYWSDWNEDPAPDHTGWYRRTFRVPAEWRGRQVDLVFGGVMTDTDVTINGQSAGPVHQGGFYEFRYDVSAALLYDDDNLVEVTVGKFSADRSVNLAEREADYWLFGGIYRPVWLEARPAQHIVRTAIDARHTGEIAIDVYLGGLVSDGRVIGEVETLDGQPIGEAMVAPVARGQDHVQLRGTYSGVQPWSAEWPNRYRIRVRLKVAPAEEHEVVEVFGFRTVELRRGDGFYINGQKIRLKGVNRHSAWPTSGRTTNRALSVQDVNLIKDMNMNAVRMSHYPPDRHFLEVTDELGLYVINELAGWQKPYDTDPGRKLVREMIVRDVNHPSIVLWANGNEGGGNFDLVDDYAELDPQQRVVIHPWLNFNGINTSHYEMYDCCTGWFFHGRDLFLPTEFLHGLYDGGHGAGLEDWWDLMRRSPLSMGGFLWVFADEGIVRQDQDGAIDVAGNSAPDGIVGPFREKEGSFYTIKSVWSPVYVEESELEVLPAHFDGRLRIENQYDFTSLDQVRFTWELLGYAAPDALDLGPVVVHRGEVQAPEIAPGHRGWLQLPLPADWAEGEGLRLTAIDPHGRDISTWTWMIHPPERLAQRILANGPGRASGAVEGDAIVLRAQDVAVRISAETGQLAGVTAGDGAFSLGGGPRLVEGESTLQRLEHMADGDDYVVTADYDGELERVEWRLQGDGWLRLEYRYRVPPHAERNILGVSFDYPEAAVTSVRWLGRGPFRVWKNRRKGVEYGVWEKSYNDVMTGLQWDYPEFKGYHANVHWARLATREGRILMVFATDDLYLRLFTPSQPEGQGFEPNYTRTVFPVGDISFLHGIAPIGTKFHPAAAHGPAGQANLIPRHGGTYEATVYFRFSDPAR